MQHKDFIHALHPQQAMRDLQGGTPLREYIQDIEQGTMYATLYWTPINLGRDTAQTVEKILSGQTVPKRQSRGTDIITKANVEKYKTECTF